MPLKLDSGTAGVLRKNSIESKTLTTQPAVQSPLHTAQNRQPKKWRENAAWDFLLPDHAPYPEHNCRYACEYGQDICGVRKKTSEKKKSTTIPRFFTGTERSSQQTLGFYQADHTEGGRHGETSDLVENRKQRCSSPAPNAMVSTQYMLLLLYIPPNARQLRFFVLDFRLWGIFSKNSNDRSRTQKWIRDAVRVVKAAHLYLCTT